MKRYLLLLSALVLLQFSAAASQIVVGLRSDNLISWSIWKREGFGLKHYLLLFNKGPQTVEIKLTLRRFASDGSRFTDVSPHTPLAHRRLAAGQLAWLPYPKQLEGRDYAEYFEIGASIGLLPGSTGWPPKAVLKKQFRFYANQGADARWLGYWLALDSVQALPRRIALTAVRRFPIPNEIVKEEYHLVKLFPDFKFEGAPWPQAGALDSLAATDATITRFDRTHSSAVVSLPTALSVPGFSYFTLYIERVNDGYHYDEARHLVPDKSFGSTIGFIPVFPRATR